MGQIFISLLTILFSGLLATIVTHYLTTSHQEKQFRRQKLEELYFSMDGFCTVFVSFNAYWPGVMDGKIDYHAALDEQIKAGDKKNERYHQTAEMLVNIYFPLCFQVSTRLWHVEIQSMKSSLHFKSSTKQPGPMRRIANS